MFEVLRHLAPYFCTSVQRHSRGASHLSPIEFGPILYRNRGRHHLRNKIWTDLMGLEPHHCLNLIIDNVSNLSPYQKSVMFSISLLFNTDSPYEIGIGNNLSQRRHHLRTKHFKIRNCFPSIDCDVRRSSIDFAISTSLIHDLVTW